MEIQTVGLNVIFEYDSSELGEELFPVSSSLPLRAHKLYIRVSFSGHFFKMGAALCYIDSCHYQQRKKLSLLYLTG
jgi:hypothetical protein